MKKILFIEDNNELRQNTAEILELANYEVFTAENGKVGVEIALKEKPDLVVCDVMMPILDGYGVLHALQKNSATVNTPFIFVTAKAEKSDLRKGMEAGADDYIMKPFTGTELLNAVEGRLKKAQSLKEQWQDAGKSPDDLKKITGVNMLREIVQNRNINKYRKKQVIYFEGNRPSKLFYVEKGKVKTFMTNDDGKELVVELFDQGDFLGYAALLEGTNYKDTAEAMEDTEITVIPKEDFDRLIHDNLEVAQTFIKLLAKNIREKETQLVLLAYNSLRKKVAGALLQLDEKYNHERKPNFMITISRENLATIAGTATESLIRTLTDFKNEGLIELNHGSIVLLNKYKLQNLPN